MSAPVKTCSTCAHRLGSGEFARCRKAGLYIDVARRFARQGRCDDEFSGWAPRPGLLARITAWLGGWQ